MENEKFENRQSPEQKTEELKNILIQKVKTDPFGINDKIHDFVNGLKQTYGKEVLQYTLYHTLIGSTPKTELEKFDIEGEKSIENFIRSL